LLGPAADGSGAVPALPTKFPIRGKSSSRVRSSKNGEHAATA